MDDVRPFCLWHTSMPQQILTDSEHSDAHDVDLWFHGFVTHSYMLALRVQDWSWKQGGSFG